MSLEFVDRILRNWEDPEYQGLSEKIKTGIYIKDNTEYRLQMHVELAAENCRFLKPSIKKIKEYPRTKEGLISFYADHNILPAKHDKIKINAHKMRYPVRDDLLDEVNKYINDNTKNILEIGFKGGFNSLNFLNKADVKITCFDDAYYEYEWYGKNFIDYHYPQKHLLIVGKTNRNLQMYRVYNNLKADIIVINHHVQYTTVYKYIVNCKMYSTDNTVIVINGVAPHTGWGMGIYMAVNKLILEGFIILTDYKIIDSEGFHTAYITFKYNFDTKNKLDSVFDNKLPLEVYKELERKVPLVEFTTFVIEDYNNKTNRVNKDLVKIYKKKFAKFNIEFDDYLIEFLEKNYNISI